MLSLARVPLLGMLVSLALTGLAAPPAVAQAIRYRISGTKYMMGTRVETTVVHPDLEAAQEALVLASQEMERIEALLSSHLAGSEISLINRRGAETSVRVSAETYGILERAKAYGNRLDGIFDVTTAPALELWGLGETVRETPPPQAEVDAVATLIDYRGIILNPDSSTVRLARAGARISLGGIAKGYAVDRAGAILRRQGIDTFMINAGGDILTAGQPRDNDPWKVGIQHPRDSNKLIAQVQLQDRAIATSGDYERFVEYSGIRYPHIIDPRTGQPARNHQSASVVADSAEEADVLATYLFIMGWLSEDRAFMLVDAAGEIRSQDGCEIAFQLELTTDQD